MIVPVPKLLNPNEKSGYYGYLYYLNSVGFWNVLLSPIECVLYESEFDSVYYYFLFKDLLEL